MKKLAIGALVLLVFLAVLAPWVTGSITESSWEEMRQAFNRNSGGAAQLETLEYDRGYLGATALNKVTLHASELEEPVEVYLRSDISHGLTATRIETRLAPARHGAWLEPFSGEKPSLVSHAWLTGSVEGTLSIPAIEKTAYEDGHFQSKTLQAVFSVARGADQASLALSWGGFEMAQGDDRLQLSDLTLDEEMSRLTSEIWVGDIRLSIAGLSGKLPESGAFAVEDVSLVGDTRESDDGRLQNQLDFKVAAIRSGGAPYGDMRMKFVAEGFDTEATHEVLLAASRLDRAGSDAPDPGEQAVQQLKAFGELMTAVRALMSQGLHAGIPVMVVTTPDGTAELEFSFDHPELDEAQQETLVSLLQYSQGKLNLKLPISLAAKLPKGLQQRLFQLYQQGLLEEQNGAFLLEIELDGMALDVNGHPIRLPPII